jgi:hypothetical protein
MTRMLLNFGQPDRDRHGQNVVGRARRCEHIRIRGTHDHAVKSRDVAGHKGRPGRAADRGRRGTPSQQSRSGTQQSNRVATIELGALLHAVFTAA